MGWLKDAIKKQTKQAIQFVKTNTKMIANTAARGSGIVPVYNLMQSDPDKKWMPFSTADIASDVKGTPGGKHVVRISEHTQIGSEIGAGFFISYVGGKALAEAGLPEGTETQIINGVKVLVDKDGNPIIPVDENGNEGLFVEVDDEDANELLSGLNLGGHSLKISDETQIVIVIVLLLLFILAF